MDQCELLREQVKILAAEVGFHTSNLRRLIDKGENTPQEQQEIERLRVELAGKQQQLREMEEFMRRRQGDQPSPAASAVAGTDGLGVGAEADTATQEQMAKTIAKLKAVLSEKTFDMEIVSADNRILQDSLKAKTRQVQQLMEEANMLRVELTRAITTRHNAARGQADANAEADGHADAAGQGEGENTGAGSGSGEGGGGGGEGMVVVRAGELEELRSQVRLARQEADMLRQQQHQLTKDLAGARSLALTASCSAPGSAGAAGGADGSGAAAGTPSLASFLDGAYMNGPDGRADVSGLLQQVEAARAREAQWQEQRQKHQLVEAELAAARAELAAYRTAAAEEAGGVESGEGGEGTGEVAEEGEVGRKQGAVGVVAAVAARLEAEKDAMLAVREREVGELQQSLAAAQQREAALERDLSTMWVLVAELRHMGGGSRSSSVKDSECSGKEGGGGTAGREGLLDAEEMAELAGSIGGSGRWLGELRKGESMRSEGVGSEGGSEGGVSLSERAMELIRAGSAGGLGVRGGEGASGEVEVRVQMAVERETCVLKEELARRKGEQLAGLTLRELMALEADMETALTKLEVAKMRVRAEGSSTSGSEIDPTARTAPEMLTCAPRA
ncbi:unnamed protein product [Closterium sp. NIES-53]